MAGRGKLYKTVNTGSGTYSTEHVVVAEKALGKSLPYGAEVHHVNGDRRDNRNENLVICQDRAYHQLLHVRARAYKATGDANKRHCTICKEWDAQSNMTHTARREEFYHKSCRALYELARKERKNSIQA